MEDEAQRNQGMGRGREDDAAREARQASAPGARGRGDLTPEEVDAINARRAAAGKPPMGEDEEPTEEDLEGETAEGAAPV